MKDFLYLEGAYIILALIIIAITLFVTTRPFFSKGAFKKGLIYVGGFLTLLIATHYILTINRINSVKDAFNSGKEVICENRIYTKGANFVTIKKNNEWSLKGNYFVSPNYTRDFFLARCIVK